jgi:hypothetical protein
MQLRAIAREYMDALYDQNFELAERIVLANEGEPWVQYLKEYVTERR